MKTYQIPRSDLSVSSVILGLMRIAKMSDADIRTLVKTAIDAGINSEQMMLTRPATHPTDYTRQQIANASDPIERQSAQFVLLYKDLLRGQYATFADDLKQASLSDDKLGTSLGYTYTNATEVVPSTS